MERAVERLDSAYGVACRAQRLAFADHRRVLDDPATTPAARAEVLRTLAGLHAAAARAALAEADRAGGPGWLARTGHDLAWVHEHLWSGHAEPLTGVGWSELAPLVPGAGS